MCKICPLVKCLFACRPAALPTPALQSLAISAVSGRGTVTKQAGIRQHVDEEEELLDIDEELELQPLCAREVHADSSGTALKLS